MQLKLTVQNMEYICVHYIKLSELLLLIFLNWSMNDFKFKWLIPFQ